MYATEHITEATYSGYPQRCARCAERLPMPDGYLGDGARYGPSVKVYEVAGKMHVVPPRNITINRCSPKKSQHMQAFDRAFRRGSIALFLCALMLLLWLLSMLTGCKSAEQRMRGLIAAHPELVERDTVRVHDTVIVPGVEVADTFTTTRHDTITLVRDRFHVRIERRTDTLLVQGGCDPDTLERIVEVPVERYILKEASDGTPWWGWLIVALVALRVLAGLFPPGRSIS